MSRSLYHFLRQRLEKLFQSDETLVPHRRRWVLKLGKLLYLTIRKINTTLVLERAASLSFTATVTMIPLAILLVFVFDAFGSFEPAREEFRGFVQEYVAHGLETRALEWLDEFEGELQGTRTAIQGAAFVFLILAALALYRSSERTFSVIWNVPVQRGFFRKLGTFWLILTAAPLILSGSLYLRESLTSRLRSLEPAEIGTAEKVAPPAGRSWREYETEHLSGDDSSGSMDQAHPKESVRPDDPDHATDGGEGWGTWFLRWTRMLIIHWLFPISVSFFAFTIVYVYLPNARVKLNTAAVAAFLAACCWQLSTWGFTKYVETAPGLRVYGVLGIIPSFLLWMYLSWVIVIAGTALSYCLQNFAVLEREVRFRFRQERIARPVYGVLFMELVYRGFRGEVAPVTAEALATEFRVPLSEADSLVESLAVSDLVVIDASGVVTPRRAADRISPLEIMQAFPVGAGFRLPPDLDGSSSAVVALLRRVGADVEAELARSRMSELLGPAEGSGGERA